MNKADFLQTALAGRRLTPMNSTGEQFAPVNIALGKYWGKRHFSGNLPTNDSLSITLPEHGSSTSITVSDCDQVQLNSNAVAASDKFHQRLFSFLDAIDCQRPKLRVSTQNNIATAAGLASSASGFAALIGALDQLCNWQLSQREWSILARIGSGSACRSIANGFVRWHRGERADGLDSFAQPINTPLPGLAVGLLTLTTAEKAIGSTQGMQQTLDTCPLFKAWPEFANQSVERLALSIAQQNISALLAEAEHNAMTMHATMIATQPSILYWQPESVAVIQKVRALRAQGLQLYLTMDAGPNVKLLFHQQDSQDVLAYFPTAEVILPFEHS